MLQCKIRTTAAQGFGSYPCGGQCGIGWTDKTHVLLSRKIAQNARRIANVLFSLRKNNSIKNLLAGAAKRC